MATARVSLGLLLGLPCALHGCANDSQATLSVSGVQPAVVEQMTPAPVELLGSGFDQRWRLDLDSQQPLASTHRVSVRVGDEQLTAEAVALVDSARLRFQLRSGFPAGRHDVSVRRGVGAWSVLRNALLVERILPLPDAGAPPVVDAALGTLDAMDATLSGARGAEAGAELRCDPNREELVACFEFEQNAGTTILIDSSRYGNHATVSNALFEAGVDGQALLGSAEFDSAIADSESLDVEQELTIEAWIQPDASVAAGRQGIFDNQGQYGFFVVEQDALRCTFDIRSVQSDNEVVQPGRWQHVACSYDGTAVRLYLDGRLVGQSAATGPVLTTGTEGAALAQDSPQGAEFIGRMDLLRLWSRARTESEICRAAGATCS